MIHRIDGREVRSLSLSLFPSRRRFLQRSRRLTLASCPSLQAAAAVARAHGAHSLAHRSAGPVELSPRQQVQYGRRYPGL